MAADPVPHTVRWWDDRDADHMPIPMSMTLDTQAEAIERAEELVSDAPGWLSWVNVFRSDNEAYTVWRWRHPDPNAWRWERQRAREVAEYHRAVERIAALPGWRFLRRRRLIARARRLSGSVDGGENHVMAAENDVIQFLDARLASEVVRREQAEADRDEWERCADELTSELGRLGLDGGIMQAERDAALARAEQAEAGAERLERALARQDELGSDVAWAALARAREAEAKVRELHRALSEGYGVEDGGIWEDRALAAERELDKALAEVDEWKAYAEGKGSATAMVVKRDHELNLARAESKRLRAAGNLMYHADLAGLGLARRAWQAETGG